MLLVGKKKQQMNISESSTEAVLAANPYIGKAVYCIDNVSTDVKEADMRKFINDLGVHLISCFKVAPRRPAWWNKIKNINPTGILFVSVSLSTSLTNSSMKTSGRSLYPYQPGYSKRHRYLSVQIPGISSPSHQLEVCSSRKATNRREEYH